MSKILTQQEAIEWYVKNRPLYKQLANKVEIIIKELLEIESIPHHAVYSRSKDVESYAEKIEDTKYKDYINDITDFAGIRVIAYVEADVSKICSIIEKNFQLDPKRCVDKRKELGIDKVGYKSIHYVANLTKDRIALPEYKKFESKYFEIQVRTILEHAWAEIEHDRDYKFSGELPTDIQRRFRLLAGSLEVVDREFDNLAKEIDKYIAEVETNTKKGELEIEVNSTSLKQFLLTRFPILVNHKEFSQNFAGYDSDILQEIQDYGIKNLKEFDQIIPKHIEKNYMEIGFSFGDNFLGLTRNILIINDYEKYFTKCWNRKKW